MTIKKVMGSMLLAVALFGLATVMGGCSTNYDETYYQGPNWTPEGLIYCQKSVTHYQKDPLGTITLGTDYSYVTMDTDGNNETTLPYNGYPYYSPKGTYVALISGKTISIIRRSDNQQVYSFSPSSDSIGSLDWGPDEDKLVFKKSISGHLFVINIDGSHLKEISSVDVVEYSWKYNSKIVCFDSASGTSYLSFVSQDGSSIEATSLNHSAIGSYPNYYFDGNHVLTAGDSKFYKIDTNTKMVVASYPAELPKGSLTPIILSPDSQKVLGGFVLENGIWMIDINGGNYKQIK